MSASLSNEGLVWMPASNGDTVDNAVVGGSAEDGTPIYIARAIVQYELAPGKLHLGHDYAHIPSFSKEVKVKDYELLTNRSEIELKWVKASNGSVPPGAIIGGIDGADAPIYITKCSHAGGIVPGKLIPSSTLAFIGWGGKEHVYNDYEVLCVKNVTVETK